MEELDKVKPTETKLVIGGIERLIKFGFSAWAKIEEKYGNISNLSKLEEDMKTKPFKTCCELIWLGLKDRSGVTEETVLDDYGMTDIQMISETIGSALYGSLPKGEEKKRMKRKTE